MQPIRQIIDDAPEMISVPPEFHHRRIEFILWPLDEFPDHQVLITPSFNIAYVERIEISSRDEHNAR